MRTNLLAAVAAAACTLVSAASQAAVLTPGEGATTPDILGVPSMSTATLLATTGSVAYTSGPTGLFHGLITESVWSDSLNPFHAGDLTWVIQASSSDTPGANASRRITASSFGHFQTDVGFQLTGFATQPSTVDRLIAGDPAFNFPTGIGNTPGGFTELLIIATNAPAFGSGSLAIASNVESARIAAFAPVPEPSTWAMMLLGFAGLAFVGFRSRRRSISIV
jgi:hypothetical protein